MKKYIDNFIRYQYLLSELVKKGIKLKYRRSYLGILWSLLEPLLQMIVLTIVFGTLFGNHTKEFPVYILTGRLLYSFYSQATKGSVKSIRKNAAMIKKIYVPKYLYVMSDIIFNYIIFLISLIVLAIIAPLMGVYPTLGLIRALIPLTVIFVLAYGCGMILATIGVFFRDMEYLWGVCLMLVMYTCAIFYPVERLMNSGFGWILKLNPLYCCIELFRDSVFNTPFNPWTLWYAIGFSIVATLIGLFFFKKKQDEFILHI